jgi:peptide/nickel transport system permease protein
MNSHLAPGYRDVTTSALREDLSKPALNSQPLARSRGLQIGRRLLRNRGATLAALVLLGFVVTALLAPVLAPHDPLKQDLRHILAPPSTATTVDRKGNVLPPNYLGTDRVGRDLLSRIVYGARVSLLVSVVSIVCSAVIGTLLSLLAGFYRGMVDTVIMTAADIQLSFPTILLAISIVAGLGPGLRNTVIVLTITSWVWYARVIRSEVLSLREEDFVLAARALGCTNRRIVFRHILQQVLPMLLVLSTLQLGRVIILEAALSFLGLGVQPPQPSWGNLLADGRALLWTAWWMAVFPGLALSLVIWSSNILGDWIRDALDPRLRR